MSFKINSLLLNNLFNTLTTPSSLHHLSLICERDKILSYPHHMASNHLLVQKKSKTHDKIISKTKG